MANPKAQGRMIRADVANSKKVASLSPKACALFFLILPHFNAHGKQNGDPHYVKGQTCKLVPWMTIPEIKRCLREISEKTNVKWFQVNDVYYLHSINFQEHQSLETTKKGLDTMPSWGGGKERVADQSPTSRGPVAHEVEVEVEVEVEDKEKEKEGNAGKPAATKITCGEFENVQLREEEIEKLEKRFGQMEARERINRLSEYMQSHGKAKKYRDHYATILAWARREEPRQTSPPPKRKSGWDEAMDELGNDEAIDVTAEEVKRFE